MPDKLTNHKETEFIEDSASANQTMNRRELLKALTAIGGGAALSAMSGRWIRPVIEVGLLPAHAQASQASPNSIRFTIPSNYTWTVPSGVRFIHVIVAGAQGGGSGTGPITDQTSLTGGLGGLVEASNIAVTPGETLDITVGGRGGLGTLLTGGAGGFGGGGNGGDAPSGGPGGCGGGGWSRIFRGATPLVVAGGGGGTGANGPTPAGHGGGDLGENGASGPDSAGGQGGANSGPGGAGGVGSNGTDTADDGGPGGNGFGGDGGDGDTSGGYGGGAGGGGGGGGYFGGGGGGGSLNTGAGAGGGGASYIVSGTTVITNAQGVQTGDGLVIIFY